MQKYKTILTYFTIILFGLNLFIWGNVVRENFKIFPAKSFILDFENKSSFSNSFQNYSKENKKIKAIFDIYSKILKEPYLKFLVLFQNEYELRPTGGYLGTYGIVKIKNGKLNFAKVYDTVVLDSKSRYYLFPPEPIYKYLKVKYWQMRDANYYPDFKQSAQIIENFYKNEAKDFEKIDGVIAINTKVFETLLKYAGPIYIESLRKTLDYKNIILELIYEVEIGYIKRGISRYLRKNVLNEVLNETLKKAFSLNLLNNKKFINELIYHLDKKDILVYLKNSNLQKIVEKNHWDGGFDKNWNYDFISIIDFNINSLKSDFFIKRSIDYTINLDYKNNLAISFLKISYKNLARFKSWRNTDYTSFLRVYLPRDMKIIKVKNLNFKKEYQEYNKKVISGLIFVPVNQYRNIEISYTQSINKFLSSYKLKILKQPGINTLESEISIISEKIKSINLKNYSDYFLEAPDKIKFTKIIDKDVILTINFK